MKIINSGQPGIEVSALVVAWLNNIKTSGYIPENYKTVHGNNEKLKTFGLIQEKDSDFKLCMEKNINMADATICMVQDVSKLGKAESFVINNCSKGIKPFLTLEMNNLLDPVVILDFIKNNNIKTLHITGKFDKKNDKTIYKKMLDYFKIFERIPK